MLLKQWALQKRAWLINLFLLLLPLFFNVLLLLLQVRGGDASILPVRY